MGLYGKHVLPRLVHLACGAKPLMRQREKVVPAAAGEVLEVGIGSGLNLPYYDPEQVSRVIGLDPSPEMTGRAIHAAATAPFEVRFLSSPAEEIPLESGSVDTAVLTWTLCTIPDPGAALRQVARVLRPDGRLLFCEHGLAPDEGVRRWQHRMTPLWRRLGGGCHLNRDIPALLERSGFRIAALETMYIPGWRPACFNYWGTALPPGAG